MAVQHLYTDTTGDVTENWFFDTGTGEVHVVHDQDAQPTLDWVQRQQSISDGKGQTFWHVARTPVIVAKAWAEHRGIPWEAFCYTNEYEAEWNRMISEQKRLSPTGGKM